MPARERQQMAQTCRLFDAAARSLRREAAGAVVPGRAAAVAVAAILARNPGVHTLRITTVPRGLPARTPAALLSMASLIDRLQEAALSGRPVREPASLLEVADAAGRVRSLRLSPKAALVFRHLGGVQVAFPALRELRLDLGGRAAGAPDLGALRALRELTALTAVNATGDAGLRRLTQLRRIALLLPDHGDVPRECRDCGDVHAWDLLARAGGVNEAPPVQVGRDLWCLPHLEHLVVSFKGGDGMAGFNAARNCFEVPKPWPGAFPALREVELRDVGGGESYAEEAPGCAVWWRGGRATKLFLLAPLLERVRQAWFHKNWFRRHRLLRQRGASCAEIKRRKFSGGRAVDYMRTVTLDEARDEWTVSLEPAP
jgi:hypothetical protein